MDSDQLEHDTNMFLGCNSILSDVLPPSHALEELKSMFFNGDGMPDLHPGGVVRVHKPNSPHHHSLVRIRKVLCDTQPVSYSACLVGNRAIQITLQPTEITFPFYDKWTDFPELEDFLQKAKRLDNTYFIGFRFFLFFKVLG